MTESYVEELWKRTAEDNIKRLEQSQVQPYLGRLHERLSQLKRVLTKQDNTFVVPYLDIVLASISCLQLKHVFEGQDQMDFSLTIDPSNSGFPTFKDFYLLEKTREQAKQDLQQLPPRDKIIENIADAVLQGRSPTHHQILLRRHKLYTHLVATKILGEFHFNQPKFAGLDEQERRRYALEWSCIERGSNVPVVYRLFLVQPKRAPPLEEVPHAGLETLANITLYGQIDLRQLVVRMDRELEDIHPKMLEKFVIGPFYHPLTHNTPTLDALLRGEEQNALLKFQRECVLSEGVNKLGKLLGVGKFFGSSRLSQWLGLQTELQLFGPLDSERSMIVPFHIKQQLVDRDEEGHACKIYGVHNGGEIHG